MVIVMMVAGFMMVVIMVGDPMVFVMVVHQQVHLGDLAIIVRRSYSEITLWL